MKKNLLALLLALVCLFSLAACSGDSDKDSNKDGGTSAGDTAQDDAEDSIVGTWKGDEAGMEVTYTFKSNGNFTANYASGTYTVSGNKITLTSSGLNLFDNVSFTVNGDTLTMGNYTYTRQ